MLRSHAPARQPSWLWSAVLGTLALAFYVWLAANFVGPDTSDTPDGTD